MTKMYRKTPSLMEIVVRRENLEAAVKSVMRNKGAAGIDGMTVFEIEEHIKEYYIPLRNKLLKGSYQP